MGHYYRPKNLKKLLTRIKNKAFSSLQELEELVSTAESFLEPFYNAQLPYYNTLISNLTASYPKERLEVHQLLHLTAQDLQNLEGMRKICLKYSVLYATALVELSSYDNLLTTVLSNKYKTAQKIIQSIHGFYGWTFNKGYSDYELQLDETGYFPEMIHSEEFDLNSSNIENSGQGLFFSGNIPVSKNTILGFYPGEFIHQNKIDLSLNPDYQLEYRYINDPDTYVIDGHPDIVDQKIGVHRSNMAMEIKSESEQSVTLDLSQNNAYFLSMYHPDLIKSIGQYQDAVPDPTRFVQPNIACISTRTIEPSEEIFAQYSFDSEDLELYAEKFLGIKF